MHETQTFCAAYHMTCMVIVRVLGFNKSVAGPAKDYYIVLNSLIGSIQVFVTRNGELGNTIESTGIDQLQCKNSHLRAFSQGSVGKLNLLKLIKS